MQCFASSAQSLRLTLITGKTLISEICRNLRPHCFGEGNRVEHFFNFWRFCSTFKAARTEFGVGGRTFSQFFEILFYFRGRAPHF